MSITATEFKMNFGKYLLLCQTEDIYITKNGKVVAKLSNPNQDRVDIARSLFGVIPDDMTLEEAQEDAIETLINWMCNFYSEHNISEPDKTKWTEKQQEDWDMMINECSTCVAQYDPNKDEYKIIWYPPGQKEKEIGLEYINP